MPLPSQPGPTSEGLMVNTASAQPDDQTLTLHFSLALAPGAEKQVEERVAKGEVIPPAELDKIFAAKPDDTQKVVSWLKTNGYQVTQTSSDGIYAQAKASQIARTLDVNMVPVTKDGVTYTSAQNAPSMPQEVGAAVRSINGLQPFRQANSTLR